MSEKSCVVFDVRISSCASSARYYQKPQPNSQGRPTRSSENLRVSQSAPSFLAYRHAMPSAGCLKERYYAWRARPPSKRAKVDADLKKHIKAFHTRSDGTYGAPRIWERSDGYGHPSREEARGAPDA